MNRQSPKQFVVSLRLASSVGCGQVCDRRERLLNVSQSSAAHSVAAAIPHNFMTATSSGNIGELIL